MRLGEIVFRAVADDIADFGVYYTADRRGVVNGRYKAAPNGIGNEYQLLIPAKLFFKVRVGIAFQNALKRYFAVKLNSRERRSLRRLT